jgi:hypothetical protein
MKHCGIERYSISSNTVKKRIYILFIFLACSAFATHPDPPRFLDVFSFTKAEVIDNYTTRIPFKLADRLIVIEGQYRGKKGSFILDTGSERLLLNKAYFSDLIHEYSNHAETAGVLDDVEDPVEKRVRKILFKNLSVENKRSHIIDMRHIEKSKKIKILGIIGYNVLKDYEVFVDMYLNQITLTKTDASGNKLGNQPYLEEVVDSIDFQLKKHTIVIRGTIHQKKLTFGLDSGAEFNQISNRISKQVLKSFYPKKRVKLIGASHRKIEVLYGDLHKVKLSETVYFGPMKTLLTNLNHMNKAFGTKLDGILGHDFFAQKRAIINYKKQRIYFIDFPIQPK